MSLPGKQKIITVDPREAPVEPERTITVDPITAPSKAPEPAPTPEREPEKVPA